MERYDEWKLNPPEPVVVYNCEECGCDIHKGELYFNSEGTILCEEKDCFTKHALKQLQYQENYA